MTTGQASKKWSTDEVECTATSIRQLCKYGIIPFAELKRKKWDIPADAIKPPLSACKFVKLMRLLYSIGQGADIDFSKTGIPINSIKEGYQYLASFGFITKIKKADTLMDMLTDVTVTDMGEKVISDYEKDHTKKTTTEYHGDFELGPVGVGAKRTIER